MPKIVLFKLSEAAATAAAGVNLTESALTSKAIVANLALASKSVQKVGGMCVDYSGNIYVSDSEQHVIIKVNESGKINTFAGLAGTSGNNTALQGVAAASARFNQPKGLACDKSGNIYVADYGNNQIRVIKDNRVSLFAGNGAGTAGLVDASLDALQSRFSHPTDVAVDASGVVYVSDTDNHAVRKIWGGNVLTIAGGASSNANNVRASKYINFCNTPTGITVNRKGDIFVLDSGNNEIKKITPNGWVYRFSGGGGVGHSLAATSAKPAYECTYNTLRFVDCDSWGYLYVTDYDSGGYSRLVKVNPFGVPSNIVDFHVATTSYAGVEGVAVSPAGKVFVSITTPSEVSSSSSSYIENWSTSSSSSSS
jgi:sugar lactone lactonase YvrE